MKDPQGAVIAMRTNKTLYDVPPSGATTVANPMRQSQDHGTCNKAPFALTGTFVRGVLNSAATTGVDFGDGDRMPLHIDCVP